jgi:hypothetical protein
MPEKKPMNDIRGRKSENQSGNSAADQTVHSLAAALRKRDSRRADVEAG